MVIISDLNKVELNKPILYKILESMSASGLYVIDPSSNSKMKLIDTNTYFKILKTDGNWVYITDPEYIWKINIKTLQKVKLIPDKINSDVFFYNGWIYYSNASDKNKIYKINEKTSLKIKLNNISSEILAVVNDHVYYGNKIPISIMNTDGTNKKDLVKSFSHFEAEVDGWLYYNKVVHPESYGLPSNLHKIRLDGTHDIKLTDETVTFKSIEKDKIYFKKGTILGTIGEMNRDGSKIQTISDENMIINISKINDWIYYIKTDHVLYRLNIKIIDS